jgi:ribosomal protein S18 acetylase RimI-like enzyme
MAFQAICATRQLQLAALKDLRANDLEPLLAEEIAEWRRVLDWDYTRSAKVVRTLADAGSLAGAALLDDGEVVGLGYCGIAEGKGQIWDVYVRPEWRHDDVEPALFDTLVQMLVDTRAVRRIECQLLLDEAGQLNVTGLCSFERMLMRRETAAPLDAGYGLAAGRFRLERWGDRYQEAAATVLSLAHAGHVDAQMSDQYRTSTSAMRFIHDLVRFPGSATFCRKSSFVAFDRFTGLPAGIALTNFVADGVGHIGELCVTPESQGYGLGYQLLREAVTALGLEGANRISLTVTAGNHSALNLYSRCGFREMRRFHAYVWEDLKPPSPSIR